MTTEYVFPQALQAGNLAQSTGGLSLRDYFAAQALPAVTIDCLRVLEKEGFPDEKWRDGIASESYKMADAMIRARQSTTTE